MLEAARATVAVGKISGAVGTYAHTGPALERYVCAKLGLEPAPVSHWIRGEEKAQLVEYPGQVPETTQRIVLTAISGSSATPAEGIVADVVVVHSFDELTSTLRR